MSQITRWPLRALGDLVENGELSYGVVQPGTDRDSGVPIVRVKDLARGRIDSRSPMRVAPEIAARHQRTSLRGGEVLLTIVGTVGESAVVPGHMAGWNVARALAVIRPWRISPEWVHYCLESPSVRASFYAVLNTTVQTTLNLSDLKRLLVPVPPAPVRAAIVDVLGAIDDKIAANNALLSAIDEYLGGCFARLISGCTNIVSLGDLADVNAQVVDPIPGQLLRYIDISSVGIGRFEVPALSSWDNAPGRARRGLRPGDTMWSTVRPSRRSHALNLSDDPKLVASTGLAVLSPKAVGFAYLYELTRRLEFTEYLESVAEGSTYPAVRAERFASAPMPLAHSADRETFEGYAAPLRSLGAQKAAESRTLGDLRDLLLPPLMTGEIRVKDAERAMEQRF